MNYEQVVELSEVTLEDCLNLYNVRKRVVINDGKIVNILDEDE